VNHLKNSSFLMKVTPDERGMRLLAYLKEKKAFNASVKSLKRAIETRLCSVNGQIERFSSYVLGSGDVIELKPVQAADQTLLPITLYEDKDLLICSKPAGLLSETVPDFFVGCQIVHRLDKDTSGALILAKNQAMKEALIALFVKRAIKKSYLAIADGVFKSEKFKVDNFLTKKFAIQGQSIYASAKEGQRAITRFSLLKKSQSSSLVLCEPITGRTHQIRVHLSELGHPILGDLQYGKSFRSPLQPVRHLLHAYELTFCHPKTNIELKVQAPIPEDFQRVQNEVFSDC
jgi:RluA family pseudouridine synthase